MVKRLDKVEFKIKDMEKIPEGAEFLITAMPENGFSGIIALRQMVKDLNMNLAGHAVSDVTKTIFRFEDGNPKPTVPIYEKDSIVTLTFELPINDALVLPVGRLINRLTHEKNIEHLIMLSSAPSRTRKDKSYEELRTIGAYIGDGYAELAKELDLDTVDNAALSGPFAWVLNTRFMEDKGALILLSETYPSPMVDPESSAKLLDVLGQIIGKKDQLNIEKLIQESRKIKSKMKKIQQTTQKTKPQNLASLYT